MHFAASQFLQDDNIQFTVLTDRSQGGSSLKNGSVEVMVRDHMILDWELL